jgi:hypothetical protein
MSRSLVCNLLLLTLLRATAQQRPLPSHVPPKRPSQIENGFGINSGRYR